MLYTVIKKNSYQDSVVLMLLSSRLSGLDGVIRASVMMGTPANKDIMGGSGLRTAEVEEASANDMMVVVEAEDPSIVEPVIQEVEAFLNSQTTSTASTEQVARNWEQALRIGEGAQMALFSIPGTYVALEAERALDAGLHAFIFSDNVPLEDEQRLKEKAHRKGLLVMGPDCGTAVIGGVPLAFANVVRRGNIGVVGASGTGLQEVTCLIDHFGGGVSHALGTGGRDLASEIGGVTMLDAVAALAQEPATEVLVVLSKPPAQAVRDRVLDALRACGKPAVALFLGEKPEYHEEGLYRAHTLEETARIAVALASGKPIVAESWEPQIPEVSWLPGQNAIKGYYSGGTLAGEAGMLIREAFDLPKEKSKQAGYVLKQAGCEIIDLGDDVYTQGKPHPMLDPEKRLEFIARADEDPATAVVLFDVVLGYGSHADMSSALAPAIEQVRARAEKNGRPLFFVTSMCGTHSDPQGYQKQKEILERAGVLVYQSNNQAVRAALALLGRKVSDVVKDVRQSAQSSAKLAQVSPAVEEFLSRPLKIVNVGLRGFSQTLREAGAEVVQFDWRPVAGGDLRLQKVLHFLDSYGRAEA